MPTLERALQIAVQAHAGQKDRNGEAYIFHPLRVMARCSSAEARILALLHDVVEDTSVTFADLEKEGFPSSLLNTLRLLTHDESVSYDDYITQIMTDPLAVEVKLADLEDNSDIRRLQQPPEERTLARVAKYIRAYQRLSAWKSGQTDI